MSGLQEAINRCDLIAIQVMQLKEFLCRDEGSSKTNTAALRRSAKGNCVYCDEQIEEGEKHFRGAHQRCYKKVNRLINAGQISEDTAIERGWILPAERGGRPLDADDPIAKYLAEAQQIAKAARKK